MQKYWLLLQLKCIKAQLLAVSVPHVSFTSLTVFSTAHNPYKVIVPAIHLRRHETLVLRKEGCCGSLMRCELILKHRCNSLLLRRHRLACVILDKVLDICVLILDLR
jgi:hypothetical protein